MSMKLLASSVAIFVLAGCASVSMESKDKSDIAKKFNTPTAGNAGLYIYRFGSLGAALTKNIWVDGKCIGKSAPNVFFYEEVKGDADHKISTESEFSPNDLMVKTVSGTNYFIRQFIKFGVFIGGAGLELVSDDIGKKEVSDLGLANKGTCSQ